MWEKTHLLGKLAQYHARTASVAPEPPELK